MGISGLLPFLKPISRQVHLRDFQGECIGIDAYSWLHKGVFSCSFEIMTGKPTRRYIDYCVKKIKLLQHHHIIPLLVFDGGNLAMKKGTENDRKSKREEKRKLGFEALKAGNVQKATEYFQTCVDITPEMAAELIVTLKTMSVQFVVAPYEADAQLAYMNRIGTISSIISEDSDLLCFGCTRVIYKLNNDATAIEIRQQDFGNLPSMRNWSLERFRQMCILSGCDYLASPPGIGVITAAKLLKKTDAYTLIKSWVAWGSTIKAPKIPRNYMDLFRMAELTFLYQRVYDPETERLVPLNPFPDGFELTREISEAIGQDIEPHIVKRIALGLVNPESKLDFNLGNISGRAGHSITSIIRAAPRLTALFNARQYNTSTAVKLKHPVELKAKSDFFKPDPSRSGNAQEVKTSSQNDQTDSGNTIVNTGDTNPPENTVLVKSFAAVVKSSVNNQKQIVGRDKKPVVVVSKHFATTVQKLKENPQVHAVADEDAVKQGLVLDDDVQIIESKSRPKPPPIISKLPKNFQKIPFKQGSKKPLQSKISHHFMKPVIPKLSPLTRTDSKLFSSTPLKRPLNTIPSLTNLLPPSKKHFSLKK